MRGIRLFVVALVGLSPELSVASAPTPAVPAEATDIGLFQHEAFRELLLDGEIERFGVGRL